MCQALSGSWHDPSTIPLGCVRDSVPLPVSQSCHEAEVRRVWAVCILMPSAQSRCGKWLLLLVLCPAGQSSLSSGGSLSFSVPLPAPCQEASPNVVPFLFFWMKFSSLSSGLG